MRFPDEIVFEESIKEADGEVIISMLRRASLDIDINRINMAGMSALHQVRERVKVDIVVHEEEENVATVADEEEREVTKQIFSRDKIQHRCKKKKRKNQ